MYCVPLGRLILVCFTLDSPYSLRDYHILPICLKMSRIETHEQRIFVLTHWWTSRRTYRLVHAAFQDALPGDNVPTRQTIYRMAEKFDEIESTEDAPRSVRPTTIKTEEDVRIVSEILLGKHSHLKDVHHLNLVSLEVAWRESCKIWIWSRISLTCHKLEGEDDSNQRLKICEWILDSIQDDSTLLDFILWIDEVTFQINGHVNSDNCVYWSNVNPHFIIEQEMNVPRVVVWGDIYERTALLGHSSSKVMLQQRVISRCWRIMLYYNFNILDFHRWYGNKMVSHSITANCTRLLRWVFRMLDRPSRNCRRVTTVSCLNSMWSLIMIIIKDPVYAQNPRNVNHVKVLSKKSSHHSTLILSRVKQSIVLW